VPRRYSAWLKRSWLKFGWYGWHPDFKTAAKWNSNWASDEVLSASCAFSYVQLWSIVEFGWKETIQSPLTPRHGLNAPRLIINFSSCRWQPNHNIYCCWRRVLALILGFEDGWWSHAETQQ
jgi:hypothetical protein